MQVAESRTKNQFPLSPQKALKKTIAAMFGFLILAIALLSITAPFVISAGKNSMISLPILFVVLAIIFVVLLFAEYIYQTWYFKTYFYDLTENFIIIRKGVVAPTEITIPYDRVQDVYMDQDILDRLFGLYDVHVSTATMTSAFEAHIDGLEQPAAEGLRNTLLGVIQQKNVARQSSPRV